MSPTPDRHGAALAAVYAILRVAAGRAGQETSGAAARIAARPETRPQETKEGTRSV